ncbi:hypothetical protein U1Q18_005360, partial [Sarracenia purpurea var. burkii]
DWHFEVSRCLRSLARVGPSWLRASHSDLLLLRLQLIQPRNLPWPGSLLPVRA